MKRTAFALVALSLLVVTTRAWADFDFGTPSGTDRAEWFQYADLGIGFAYDPVRWVPANATGATAHHVVDWRGKQSGELIATCSLQSYERPEWSQLPEELIHTHLQPIAQGMMDKDYERSPDMSLVSKLATYADDYPVVVLERHTAGRGADIETGMTVIGEFTVWRRHAVLLECGYTDAIRKDEHSHGIVRDEILQILGSLRFERQRIQ